LIEAGFRLPPGLLAALLICSPAVAADRAPVRLPDTVAVIMDFEQPLSEVSLESMERELEGIMSSCRVHLAFRILDPSASQEAFPSLVVARFRGNCRGSEPKWYGKTHTLGLTHVSNGQILPFSEVDCDKIRSIVGPELDRHNRLHTEQLFGRALGRVLAHELYHILAKTTEHAGKGIAKPTLSVHELLSGEMTFERADSDKIRRGVSGDEQISAKRAAALR
jgi:hypothetical protein